MSPGDTVITRLHFLFQLGPKNQPASVGTAILIRNDVICGHISINSNLQARAVGLTTKKITVCPVYIPTDPRLTHIDLDHLIIQLPSPFILLGEFNTHHFLWCSKHCKTLQITILMHYKQQIKYLHSSRTQNTLHNPANNLST